jgi:hypothetical protein
VAAAGGETFSGMGNDCGDITNKKISGIAP